MTTLDLNGRTLSVQSPDDTPLLWVIRDEFGLTGSKFGCEWRLHRSCGWSTHAIMHHRSRRCRRR